MKSNMEYLRDLIDGNDEAIEFWEAVANEIEETEDDHMREVESLREEVRDYEDRIEYLEKSLVDTCFLNMQNTIDCGIGVINYEEPENLQLQCLMEELKEYLEAKFKTSQLSKIDVHSIFHPQ